MSGMLLSRRVFVSSCLRSTTTAKVAPSRLQLLLRRHQQQQQRQQRLPYWLKNATSCCRCYCSSSSITNQQQSQSNSVNEITNNNNPHNNNEFNKEQESDNGRSPANTSAADTSGNDTKEEELQHRLRVKNDLRRSAASLFSIWLKSDPTWKKRVLEILNLPDTDTQTQTTSSKSSNNNNSMVMNGGKSSSSSFLSSSLGNVYNASIPTFHTVLTSTKDGPPKSLHDALDRMVDVGLFHKGAKLFRNRDRIQYQLDQIAKDVQAQQTILAQRQERYEQVQQRIKRFQEERQNIILKSHQNPFGNGAWSDDSDSSSSSFSTDDDDDDEEVVQQSKTNQQQKEMNNNNKPHRQLQTLERQISLDEVLLQNHATTIEASTDKLVALQKQRDELLNPKSSSTQLSDSEYQAMQQAMAAAMPDVTVAFAEHVRDRHSQILSQYQKLEMTTDLTRPHDWFLRARLDRRKIIYHGGPTNSGKTYMALQRLKEAKRGLYLGPLRLLAAEVYEKLTTEGVYCNLYTGQERREIPFSTHIAATVEMASSVIEDFDVVVIDEIQMIADDERGYAWTKALLGSRSKEIHVCGGLEAANLVQSIADACGDEFVIKNYERFSQLTVEDRSLASLPNQDGCYRNVQAGDCIVAFSRNDIFAIKREIEKSTRHKCCVIYGSLPPSTRSEQARLFNDPESGYNILVASDAVGMGLNLNIRRMIFNSIFKVNNQGVCRLDHSAVKQISGRAGRRNSPFPEGVVTTRDPRDLEYVRWCMSTEIEPIDKAGLLPTATHTETFNDTLAEYGLGQHGTKNLHRVLIQFNDLASVKSDYFLCRIGPMVEIAKRLASLELPIPDKYQLCLCPASPKIGGAMRVVQNFAAKLAKGEVAGLPSHRNLRRPRNFDDLTYLCHVYTDVELFLWLQSKFPPANMVEQHAAMSRKEQVVDLIGAGLSASDKLRLKHCYIQRDRGLRRFWESMAKRHRPPSSILDDEEEDDESVVDIGYLFPKVKQSL